MKQQEAFDQPVFVDVISLRSTWCVRAFTETQRKEKAKLRLMSCIGSCKFNFLHSKMLELKKKETGRGREGHSQGRHNK